MLADVRARTGRAVRATERLSEQREALTAGSPERLAVEEALQAEVSRWAREMEALGLEVKGLWLVDFDSGAGCYCWRWPELELAFFHGYEEGFAGRTRIQ